MKILDAKGLDCPLPVVKTKELLEENDSVKTIVDNEIAVQNLEKFATHKGFHFESGKDGNDYFVLVYKGDKPKEEKVEEKAEEKENLAIVFSSNVMGSNKELGAILMKAFVFALTKQDKLPKQMIFYNEGVLLTSTQSEILNDLKTLESKGVEIVSCGTCLDFFHKKEDLQVGSVTNMYDIVERMESACQIIKP